MFPNLHSICSLFHFIVVSEETCVILDQVVEEGWTTDSDSQEDDAIDVVDELMENASLVNNLPVEEANANTIQAPMNGNNVSRRRSQLRQQLATNPVGARYNMDALLPQRNVTRHTAMQWVLQRRERSKRIRLSILDVSVVMLELQCLTIFLNFHANS